MSNVKLIMEVNGSLSEVSFDFSVKVKSSLNDWDNLFLNSTLELREMLAQESVVNCEQRSLLRERNSKSPEMSLKSWVDLEWTSSGVHTSSIKSVLNILKSQLASIIPMLVVLVLSQEWDSCLSIVRIKLGHVKIIDEIDKLEFTNWSISLTSFLF